MTPFIMGLADELMKLSATREIKNLIRAGITPMRGRAVANLRAKGKAGIPPDLLALRESMQGMHVPRLATPEAKAKKKMEVFNNTNFLKAIQSLGEVLK